MSHTNKDVPYWVRLNREGVHTDHNHLQLGKEQYRRVYKHNEDGSFVYLDEPVMVTASSIIEDGDDWYFRFIARDHTITTKVRQRALELHGAGRGNELVQIGTERVAQYDLVLSYVVPDHCTEGQKLTSKDNMWGWGEVPCTPQMAPGKRRWVYAWGMSSKRQFLRKKHYGKERTEARGTLREATKAANSGYDDWEDDFEHIEDLTNQHRHSMDWDLW